MSSPMAAEHPRIVHALRGRLRVHLPRWTGGGGRNLESRVRQIRGVVRVQANPTTSNVLVEFDPRVADQATLLSALQAAQRESEGLPEDGPPLSQLTLGMSTAISAVPEGLTLLAGAGQAGVARRLAKRKALVRRLAVVEALGRVDVACADKTGTLTEGRLAVRLAADIDEEAVLPGVSGPGPRRVLLTAALACPHPEAADAAAYPTDIAVVRAARQAGLDDELRRPRQAEAAFDPARSFHASLVKRRLCVKGSPEALVPRCSRLRKGDSVPSLDAAGRQTLLARARTFAERGLRVLLVAEGAADAAPGDPQQLTALGFVGISDPLRATVPEAVRRCQEAGVHILMLTGDHPATARAIAAEAGLLVAGHDEILTAPELAELHNGELGQRLEHTAVVARATPLDKLRIIEGLRSRGHTVAMTGDGVNDAPALRLADVGVAMGRSGTEVARQAADVVLADDEFATLVEALVAVSAGLLTAALTVPPLRTLLELTTPSPFSWLVIGGSALGAVALSRSLAFSGSPVSESPAAPGLLDIRLGVAPQGT